MRATAAEIEKEVEFAAIRSRGPGGQNVNKVSSAALATWNFEASALLSYEEKYLVRSKLTSFINKEAQFFVRSDEFRDLPQNKARCIEKILTLLAKAFHKDKPRKATKATRSSKIKKLDSKTKRGVVKKNRNKNWKADY